MSKKFSILLVPTIIFGTLACNAFSGLVPRPTPPEVLADTFFHGCVYVDSNANGELDSEDQPLEDIMFSVTLSSGGGIGGETNASGCATLTVPGGASEDFYPVMAKMEPPEYCTYSPVITAEMILEYPDTNSAFLFKPIDPSETCVESSTSFDPAKLGTVENDIPYCNLSSSDPPMMDVYYPNNGDEPWPATVYVHGGGWVGGDKIKGAGYRLVEPLQKNGYLVISVNYRLSPEYWFPAHIEDVKCAIRHLRAKASYYNLDPERIGAFGGSAGGHLVALLGTSDAASGLEGSGEYQEYSSRVAAVVDLFGPTDEEAFCIPSKIETVFGADQCEEEIITLASPMTHITAEDPPFLIIHGDKDQVVPISQSQKLHTALSAAGVPSTLITVENAGHGLVRTGDGQQNPNMREIPQIVIDFFDENLK